MPFKEDKLLNGGRSSNSFLQVINIAAKAPHVLCLLIPREVPGHPRPHREWEELGKSGPLISKFVLCRKHMGGQRWIGLCANLINAFVPTKLLPISLWVKKLLYLAATLSHASPPPHFLSCSEQSPFFLCKHR